MPRRDVRARQLLAARGIRTSRDLALWARTHGLLAVYIEYLPARGVLPACWQVIRPDHRTAVIGPSWQRGNKTFVVHSVRDRHVYEDAAVYWAAAKFDVSGWVRVEGLGNVLFPTAVAEALRHYEPELIVYRRRQHSRAS